jgi:hypothetical protein
MRHSRATTRYSCAQKSRTLNTSKHNEEYQEQCTVDQKQNPDDLKAPIKLRIGKSFVIPSQKKSEEQPVVRQRVVQQQRRTAEYLPLRHVIPFKVGEERSDAKQINDSCEGERAPHDSECLNRDQHPQTIEQTAAASANICR